MSLVHRADELAVLSTAFAEVRQGRGRVVLVVGGLAGGKTAVLQRHCDDAAAENALVLTATGARAERRLRLGLIDQLFNAAALPAETVARARRLLTVNPAVTDDVDEESSMLGQSDARTVRALCDLLLELARSGPVVIGVDDVHFADDASLQVLLYLCRRLKRAPVLLILTEWARPLPTRPLFSAEVTRLPHDLIELEPLSPQGVADLIADVSGGPVAPAAARRCHQITGGNPLLAQALAADNPDAGPADHRTTGSAYRQAVLSCLHRWEPRVLTVARGVAVLRSQARPDLVAMLTGLSVAVVSPIIEVLQEAGLLRGSRFRDEQGAAAVLDAIEPRERAAAHLRAAEILYRRGESVAEVAAHLVVGAAAPAQWAVSVLRGAARLALAEDDVELAVTALDLALTSCTDERERMEITADLAQALWRTNPAVAARRLEPLLQALDEGRLRCGNVAMVARHLLWQGLLAGHQNALAAVALAKSANAPGIIAFELCYQWIYGVRERDVLADQAEELGAAAPSPWGEAALSLRTLFYEGPSKQIARDATLILESCRLDDTTVEVMVASLFALIQADEVRLAVSWCTDLLAEATERGVTTWQALLTALYSSMVLRTGDLEQAAALAAAALEMMPAAGWGVVICLPLSVLMRANTALGRHARNEELLRQPEPAGAKDTLLGLRHLRACGNHRLATGQVLAALADFGQCGLRIQEWRMDVPELMPWRTDLAQAHLQMGNTKIANDLATDELALCRSPRSRAVATRVLAACSEPRKRPALLNAAIDALQDSDDRLELARVMTELSKAYDDLGDFSRSRIVARSADQQAKSYAAGVELTQVITVVDGGDPRHGRPDTVPVLSDAELRVARLAARDGQQAQDVAIIATVFVRLRVELGEVEIGLHAAVLEVAVTAHELWARWIEQTGIGLASGKVICVPVGARRDLQQAVFTRCHRELPRHVERRCRVDERRVSDAGRNVRRVRTAFDAGNVLEQVLSDDDQLVVVEDVAVDQAGRTGVRGDGLGGRYSRSIAGDVGVRQADTSLQVLRLDLDGALSLALQLLSELFAGPDRRLDERNLSAMGRRPRHHDRCAGQLVSCADRPEGDDRSAGLCRWRQPRSIFHPWQEGGGSQGARAQGLALSAAFGGPAFRPRRAWRQRRSGDAAAGAGRLADGYVSDFRRRHGRDRWLHRLHETLRHCTSGAGR